MTKWKLEGKCYEKGKLTVASLVILQIGAISAVVDSLVVAAHQAQWDAFSILAGEVGLTAAFRLIKAWKRMTFTHLKMLIWMCWSCLDHLIIKEMSVY